MTLEEEFELSCYKELTKFIDEKEVYLVRNVETGKIYIKKIIDKRNKDIFTKLKSLKVKGIPEVITCIEDKDRLIIIEEYIHGKTLDEYIKEKGTLGEKEAVSIVINLCDILSSIHKLDEPIVHRDIKPKNVMISNDGVVKLIDFDAARAYVEGDYEDTYLLGTKEYAAPEQFGFGQSDARTDIYALGVLLNYMIAGKYPKEKLCENKLGSIVTRCTMLDRDKRFGDVLELKRALKLGNRYRVKEENKFTFWDYLPIGFRSGRPRNMAIAIFGYILLADFIYTVRVTSAHVLTENEIILTKATYVVIFLGWIFYWFDYLGIKHSLPFTKNKGIVCSIFNVIYMCLYLTAVVILMSIIREYI